MVYFLIALVVAHLYESRLDVGGALKSAIERADQLARELKGGQVVRHDATVDGGMAGLIVRLVLERERAGLAVGERLALVRQALREARETRLARRRLWYLAEARVGSGLVALAFLRWTLVLPDVDRAVDGVACAVGAGICLLALGAFSKTLPIPWLMISARDGRGWLELCLATEPGGQGLLAEDLATLAERERFEGITLASEKIARLTEAASEGRRSDLARLGRSEDWLVAVELVGAGAGGVLGAIVPVLAALGASGV